MLNDEEAAAVEDDLGVAVIFVPFRPGGPRAPITVTTNAPRVLVARSLAPSPDVAEQRVGEALRRHAGIEVEPHGGALIARRRPLGDDLGVGPSLRNLIRNTAEAVEEAQPRVSGGDRATNYAEALREVGSDALRWSALHATRVPRHGGEVLRLGGSWATTTSRHDDHPLALVRHAHARAALSSLAPESEDLAATDAAAERLALALLLLPQDMREAVRTERTRVHALSIETIARLVLRTLEAPGTRTGRRSLAVARRVLSETLTSAGLAAPVPF